MYLPKYKPKAINQKTTGISNVNNIELTCAFKMANISFKDFKIQACQLKQMIVLIPNQTIMANTDVASNETDPLKYKAN